MSTIPSTTEKVSYTVIGGKREPSLRKEFPLLSIVLLNRAGRVFKSETISDLEKLNAYEIVSMEGGGSGYDVEALSGKHPSVKFIRIHEKITEGEKINIGIQETESKYIFVLYDDMFTATGGLSDRLMEQVESTGSLCSVPLLQSRKLSIVPTIINPAYNKRSLKIIQLPPSVDGMNSLFPFDYCGIYNKALFTKLGGFDGKIKSRWWQKMDFGFRAYMWGEKIRCKTSFMVKYLDEIPEESNTADKSYRFFYLKNLAVHFNEYNGIIPKSRFFKFYLKSGESLFQARKEFIEVKDWVEKNKYRFKMDARGVVELWEAPSI